jgi:twinkle protein
VVNYKFRALASKTFSQVKGAEKTLYGLDDIAGSKVAVITEGELDKLALDEAGIRYAVSVPDGAPPVCGMALTLTPR